MTKYFMKIKNDAKIKVNNSIKPLHTKKRQKPELIIGNSYYISFGLNEAIPCILLKVIDNDKGNLKQVHVGIKNNSMRGYGDISVLFSDEIGITPEQAVINEMTF
jgi:hypothetical protein